MPNRGHRHRLILYTYMLNRWWRATLLLGTTLLILAGGLGGLPVILPQFPFLWVNDWKLWLVGGAGGLALLLTLLLLAIRKFAYVQPFDDHVRLVTPFLRIRIPYRTIQRTTSAEMEALFPPNKIKGWRREIVRPLSQRTAVVFELNSYPIPRFILRASLAGFFFPDRSARLALLVPDWLAFSTEFESLRSLWQDGLRQPIDHPRAGLRTGPVGQSKP